MTTRCHRSELSYWSLDGVHNVRNNCIEDGCICFYLVIKNILYINIDIHYTPSAVGGVAAGGIGTGDAASEHTCQFLIPLSAGVIPERTPAY